MKTLLMTVSLLLSLFVSPISANQWFPPIPVTGSGIAPVVQLDANGNSVALWLSADSSTLFSGTLPFEGTTWDILTVTSVTGSIQFVNLGLGANGDAVAVWITFPTSGTPTLNYSSLLSGASTWSSIVILSPTAAAPFDADVPQNVSMGVAGNGGAIVVWNVNNATNFLIRAAVVPFGSLTAPTPTALSGPNTFQGTFPSVSVNNAGQAIAAWTGLDGSGDYAAIGAFYSSGWTVTQLTPLNTIGIIGLQTAIDNSGDGMAVWYDLNGGAYNILSDSLISGVWSTSQIPIVSVLTLGNAPSFQVMTDNAGDSVITFLNSTGSLQDLFSARLIFGSSVWGNYENISNSGTAEPQNMYTIPSGLTTVVWTDSTSSQLLASMLTNPLATPWSTPFPIINGSLPNLNGFNALAGNAAGEFIAISNQSDGSLESAFYGPFNQPPPLPPIPLSPSNFVGKRIFNKFLLQDEISDHLTWSPVPTSTDIVLYLIYSNANLTELVGDVSALTFPLTFVINNVQNTSQTYYVVAVNNQGVRSAPAAVTLE